MVLRAFSLLSVIAFSLCVAQKLGLPNSVPICKRDSSDYNSCLKQAIEEAWPIFVKGLPAEYGFPPLDPYYYGYEKVVIIDFGFLLDEAAILNLTIEGIKATRIEAVRAHFNNDNFRLEIDTSVPKIICYSVTEAHSSLFMINIDGKGLVSMIIEDAKTTLDISGPVKNDTWIITDFHTAPLMNKVKIKLDDFYEGKAIDELVMMLMNNNWDTFYKIFEPTLSQYWNTHFTNLLNRLFLKLSFSKVFP